MTGHSAAVRTIDFSENGTYLVSGSLDTTVKVRALCCACVLVVVGVCVCVCVCV